MRLRVATSCAVLLALSLPQPAAAQRGGGWDAWMFRVDELIEGIHQGGFVGLDVACSGLRTTLSHSGFAFPKWAQSVRLACSSVRDAAEGSDNNRRSHRVCGELKTAPKELAKAKEGPGIPPGAVERAHRLSRMVWNVREAACFGR